MKKAGRPKRGEMRREYDFASVSGGVRGKYAARMRTGTNLVLLDDDVAAAFPTSAAVNDALRAVLAVASRITRRRRPAGGRSTRRPKPAAAR